MFNLKVLLIAVSLSLGIGAGASWYIVSQIKQGHYDALLLVQERQATDALKKAYEERDRQVAKLEFDKLQIEAKYEQVKVELDEESERYSTLVADGFRLFDHGAADESNPSPVCQNDRPAERSCPPCSSGRGALSKEATAFLLSESARADRVRLKLELCRDWVDTVRDLNK